MSNQLQVINLSGGALQVPDYIRGLPTIVGNIPVGDARNRLGLKGREFHVIVGGVEEGVIETKHCDVFLVGALPYISRQFYDKPYEDGVALAPACYSVDGKVPAADVQSPQSDKCNTCQWNVKGSALNGQGKSKACGFLRRMAVMLVGDPEYRIFQLDLKALSLWNDGDPEKGYYSFQEYAKKLQAHNIDAGTVKTRLRFDANASVPALTFQAIGYAEPDDIAHIMEAVNDGSIARVLEMNMQTVDLSKEQHPQIAAPQQEPEEEAEDAPVLKVKAPAPVVRQAPRVAAPAPVADRPAPVVASRPAAAPAPRVAAPAARPGPAIKPVARTVASVAMPEDETEQAINRRGGEDPVAKGMAMKPGAIRYGQPRARTAAAPVQQDMSAEDLIAELD